MCLIHDILGSDPTLIGMKIRKAIKEKLFFFFVGVVWDL